ncbi:HEAT repeat-containing protein [Caldanaerobius fijiensis DSM 17918]|uniref:HEAT repeat-containing protein n=1 Tax=Caldanaerobius fijiensis DSM 17918 TaxID=1121256 RepID=A0A1M5ESA3_9THEO|nr:HEAT repeat domain-containing protein [Caldanaerobius fijiensis]SHF82000.1 HEAT repeat-containing protein [Caldanaerobius fijiensis DSM 17918]
MQELRISQLIDLMKSGRNENERIAASLDLGDFKSKNVIEALIEQLRVETSRAVQEAIVSSLIKIGNEDVAEAVAELLESDDAYLRNVGVEVLATIGNSALEVLEKMIMHSDKDVRQQVVNAIGEGQLKEAVMILRRVIEEDEEENVVAAAIEYLGEIGGGEEDRKAILQALNRFSSPFFQYAAEVALKKLGGSK